MNIARPQTPLSASTHSSPLLRSRHSISSTSLLSTLSTQSVSEFRRLQQAVELFQERPLEKEITPSLMSLVEAVQDVLCAGAPSNGLLFSQPAPVTALALLSQATLKETMQSVQQIAPDDPQKQLQAWIIIALNESLLPTYFQILSDNDAPRTAGYSHTSSLLAHMPQVILMLTTLLEHTEFQLHLEDFVEYKPVQPAFKTSGSIVSRTSAMESRELGLAQLSSHSSQTPASLKSSPVIQSSASKDHDDDVSDMDSTKESPRSQCVLEEPIPVSPPSPLIQAENNSRMSSIYTWATSFFTSSPSPSSLTDTSLYSDGVESLLNIRDGIICGSLLNQGFNCPQCKTSLVPKVVSVYCEFSGKFYCKECMGDLTMPNPFRVLNNWDFTPQPVYHPLQHRVQNILETESFLLSEQLIDSIPQLSQFRDARVQLSHRFAILLVREDANEAERIRALLGEHAHLVTESADVYTICDLIALHEGRLSAQRLLDILKDDANAE